MTRLISHRHDLSHHDEQDVEDLDVLVAVGRLAGTFFICYQH